MAKIQNLDSLKAALSADATIDLKGDKNFAVSSARWSELGTPKPGAVVNVACEADIQAAVKWATSNNVPFVAQSGSHAWSSWFRINDSGIVINLRKLNTIEIDLEKGHAVLGGAVTVVEAVTAAKKAGAGLVVGTCNGVGVVPAMLGGGSGHLMGMYGIGADNIISARLITATGEIMTVSATENPDLFWGLCGAGHNFGIVSSIVVKAYPEINGGMHFVGVVGFPREQLDNVVNTINALEIKEDMSLQMLFGRMPPTFQPVVVVSMWHAGDVEGGKERFKSIFDLGGMVIHEGLVPFDHLNDGLDPLCKKGGIKLTYSLSFNNLDLEALRSLWEDFLVMSSLPGAGMSVLNFERYCLDRTHAVPADANAVGPALRTKKWQSIASAVYTEESLTPQAHAFGQAFQKKMGAVNDKDRPIVYPNFAVGNETVETLYGTGARLEKLRVLKKQYDPQGVFNHYIPIV